MEELITARLLASAGVVDLCAQRIGWDEAEQTGDGPYIVLHVISHPVDYHLKGASSLQRAVVQADCYGATRTQAKALQDALVSDLSGARWGRVRSVKVQARRNGGSSTAPTPVFLRQIDLLVIYEKE